MFKIFDIPKNAGSLARYLNICLKSDKDIDAVILRNPYERFWSATKTVVDEISLFGGYPIDFTKKPIKSYKDLKFSIEDVINKSLTMLNNEIIDGHLQTQSEFIGDKKFHEILFVETLDIELKQLIEKYEISTIENFTIGKKVNKSPKERDEEAIEYIMNTPSVKSKLDEFYKKDFELYNNPNSIKKIDKIFINNGRTI
jgi:hypothetical protein